MLLRLVLGFVPGRYFSNRSNRIRKGHLGNKITFANNEQNELLGIAAIDIDPRYEIIQRILFIF